MLIVNEVVLPVYVVGALSGVPITIEVPAGRALAAARTIVVRLSVELPDIRTGTGILAGRAVAGNVGGESRFQYTVISDPISQAARPAELAKEAEGGLLAGGDALEIASDAERTHWQETGTATLRGRSRPTVIAEPRVTTAGQ